MAKPRKQKRQWLAGPERRKQLLTVALQVAAKRGLGRTGHIEIAHDAGVAVSSVFLYFPTRQQLLAEIVAEVARYYIDLAHHHHQPANDPLEAVHKHFYGFANSVTTDPDYAQVWLEWAVLTRNEDHLWDRFLDFQETIIGIVAASIRRCHKAGSVSRSVPASDAARLLVASAYTTTQLKFMRRSQRVIRRFTEQALKLTLHQ
jgi:TetR/AcrR family hemagglutinin/protease transcriptional regulator